MGKSNLSGMERQIMTLLWKNDRGLTFEEIFSALTLKKGNNWTCQILEVHMVSLAEKKIIAREEQNGLFVYRPLIADRKSVRTKIESFRNRFLKISVNHSLLVISENAGLNDDSIKELRAFIDG